MFSNLRRLRLVLDCGPRNAPYSSVSPWTFLIDVFEELTSTSHLPPLETVTINYMVRPNGAGSKIHLNRMKMATLEKLLLSIPTFELLIISFVDERNRIREVADVSVRKLETMLPQLQERGMFSVLCTPE